MLHNEIDFKWFDIFIEYHPWDRLHRSVFQYYIDRRKILDENNYKNNPLLVITKIEELNKYFGVDNYETKRN